MSTLPRHGKCLEQEKKQQILALGQLGWSLRRIQQATRVRRETISGYLKAAGITVWRPGGWSRRGSKPAMRVITGSVSELPALKPNLNPEKLPIKRRSNSEDSKPAMRGPEGAKPPSSRSACEPFQEAIQLGLSRGRNARAIWQDLVSDLALENARKALELLASDTTDDQQRKDAIKASAEQKLKQLGGSAK